MVWLNVDITRLTLHREDCRYAIEHKETPFKGDGELKRDGGWLSFPEVQEAKRYHQRHFPGRHFQVCKICQP